MFYNFGLIALLFLLTSCGSETRTGSTKEDGAQATGSSYVPTSLSDSTLFNQIPDATAADIKNDPKALQALQDVLGPTGTQKFLDYLNKMENPTTADQGMQSLAGAQMMLAMFMAQADEQLNAMYNAYLKALSEALAELKKQPTQENMKKTSKKFGRKMGGLSKLFGGHKKSSGTGDGSSGGSSGGGGGF